MSTKKNIDRLFQEKFKDFETAPNDAVWNRISDSLPNKKKKRRVIALWWQIGGVAAVIALLLTVGGSIFNSSNPNNVDVPIVDVENTEKENNNGKEDTENTTIKNEVKELITNSENEQPKVADLETETVITKTKGKNQSSTKEAVSNQLANPNKLQRNNTSVVNTNQKENKSTTNQKLKELSTVTNEKTTKVASNSDKSNLERKESDGATVKNKADLNNMLKKQLDANNNTVVENSATKTRTDATADDELDTSKSVVEEANKESILDAIAENSNPIDEKEKEKLNRWSIAPNVAPVYFNTLGQGSSLDTQFNENTKSGDLNMSYGVAGSYAITNRLKVRTGISQVNLNQQTSDVFAFSGPNPTGRGGIGGSQYANIKFKNGGQPVTLMSSKMFNRATTPEIFNTKTAGVIDQRFGFLEVPLELEYRVMDKRFGVNVIGGFSTFFLNNNEIYADIDGTSTLIGEATNISGTSFSANFGLGMDYSLSKQWNINLEPTFKYQVNTFNNTSGNFRPFFIGVYTGLSFKF